MFKNPEELTYTNYIFGNWGEFSTPSGTVHYLSTKARIGHTTTEAENRLTQFLRPVREILPTEQMDFNQLLQRDLDDHRVATSLVPYILNSHKNGPTFFPPIVAAVLPFNGKDPVSEFPEKENFDDRKDPKYQQSWSGYEFKDAFRFSRLLAPDEQNFFEIRVGSVEWNQENARFVVIDGQHRAMALLAIHRTINNAWNEGGEQYRYFYEPEIERILSEKSEEERRSMFEAIEIPVTLLWFPDASQPSQDQHQAARRLFVDVNKNARTPSESRLLLLSDIDLQSIFTRRVLNEFRSDDVEFPIAAIEYDHPGHDQASTSKWSVVTNVITLRECINRSVFGPPKYITDIKQRFGGRESEAKRSRFMQETLSIQEGIPEMEENLAREDISNTRFPSGKIDFLNDQLMQSWGGFIVLFLSELLPYKAHGDALKRLDRNWATGGATDRLAKSAIFEGVGMFWTIRDSATHWEERNKLLRDSKKEPLDKTDVVKTWEVIRKKRDDFRELRAQEYLGHKGKRDIDASDYAYHVFQTSACQVGLVLCARSIAQRGEIAFKDLKVFHQKLIDILNDALTDKGSAKYGRKDIFSKNVTEGINRIPKLDTPFSTYFRYFWLELLCASRRFEELNEFAEISEIRGLRDNGRELYFDFLINELYKNLKATKPEEKNEALWADAKKEAEKSLKKSLKKWFSVTESDFESWWESSSGQLDQTSSPGSEELGAENDVNEDEEGVGGDEDVGESDLDTLLSKKD